MKSLLNTASGELSHAALCRLSGASISEVGRVEAEQFIPFLRKWKEANQLVSTDETLIFDKSILKRWSTALGTYTH